VNLPTGLSAAWFRGAGNGQAGAGLRMPRGMPWNRNRNRDQAQNEAQPSTQEPNQTQNAPDTEAQPQVQTGTQAEVAASESQNPQPAQPAQAPEVREVPNETMLSSVRQAFHFGRRRQNQAAESAPASGTAETVTPAQLEAGERSVATTSQ